MSPTTFPDIQTLVASLTPAQILQLDPHGSLPAFLAGGAPVMFTRANGTVSVVASRAPLPSSTRRQCTTTGIGLPEKRILYFLSRQQSIYHSVEAVTSLGVSAGAVFLRNNTNDKVATQIFWLFQFRFRISLLWSVVKRKVWRDCRIKRLL